MNTPAGRILLAEDNEDDAFLTTRALESAGITNPIHNCRDGQEVIDYLENLLSKPTREDSELPDLILLDLKMPRLGGLDALKWIRAHEVFKPLIVLALTSSSEERDVKAAYALQINAYLVKPSSLGEMIEVGRAIRHFWLEQKHLKKPHLSFSTIPDVSVS
jgi:two-component system response regulator